MYSQISSIIVIIGLLLDVRIKLLNASLMLLTSVSHISVELNSDLDQNLQRTYVLDLTV